MAFEKNHDSRISTIIGRFKQGVSMDDESYLFGDLKIGFKGIKLIKESLKELDALGPHGRDVLIPFLDDTEVPIRAWAAAALVKMMPERSLAALHEIRDRSMSDSRMIASHFLIMYDEGRLSY